MDKDEMKNKISMALKDPTLQQGFEIICKGIAELEKENAELKESLKKWKDAIYADVENYDGQLTKAKVFIRSLKSLIEDVCDINYLSKDNTRLLVEAEQFLNSEVEK